MYPQSILIPPPQFSIVKIQPSYFDGFRQQDPPTNDDGSNRRLFEEAAVDLMLVRAADRRLVAEGAPCLGARCGGALWPGSLPAHARALRHAWRRREPHPRRPRARLPALRST